MPIPQSAIEAFRRDGFAVVEGLLADRERAHFGTAVDEAVAARTQRDKRALADKTRYEQSFQQCLNLWEDSPQVQPLTFHPRIAEAAAALLGVDALRVWHDQALYKEAGGRVTDPHQDQPYWPLEQANTITAWIPFDGSTLQNGCMGYFAGSHDCGLRKFADIFTGTGYDLEALPELEACELRWIEVPAGAVAFHHGLTVHQARRNETQTSRRVHTVIYFADGSTRVERPHPHPSVDRAGIAPGAVVASDVTPIAWPQEEGSLPPIPALPDPLRPGWPGWPASSSRSASNDQ